ncbi:hypothetical protein [Bradyrhizobium sp. 2TAF24]|uniref:hypothetical protein n=1 Tax=Bradyrhizobium sp. 2TAF24 TaxID=3233011 RepID=UPI003F8F76E9
MSLAAAGVAPMTGNAKAMTSDVDASHAARNLCLLPNRATTVTTIPAPSHRTDQPPRSSVRNRQQPGKSSARYFISLEVSSVLKSLGMAF